MDKLKDDILRYCEKYCLPLLLCSQQGFNPPILIFWSIPLSVRCFMVWRLGPWLKVASDTNDRQNDGMMKDALWHMWFVKTRYVWMIFDESTKTLFFIFLKLIQYTFTILILEKVIDMLASKHGKNLMPSFACLVFFQQKTRWRVKRFWSTKYWIVNQDYQALSCDDGLRLDLSQEITSEQWTF